MSTSGLLEAYLRQAPISLALERAIEGRMLAGLRLEAPVLDLGCGDGLFAELTYRRPLDVGIDRSRSELHLAITRQSYRSLAASDAAALPFADRSFATVISNSVLEHFTDLDGALGEIRRVLRPSGRFWFTVPSPRYGEFLFHTTLFRRIGLKKLSRWYADLVNVRLQRNLHCFDLPEWERRLGEAGLELASHASYLPRPVMFASDLGYPLAVLAMVWKRTLRRWVLAPAARRPLARLLAGLLHGLYTRPCPDGQGAGWLIEAKSQL